MFIGHYAVGFASQRVAPRTPLVWLIAAPLFLDLLWPIFLVLGVESVRIVPGYTVVTPLDLHDYPYSHSLAAGVFWSLVFVAVYLALPRHRDDHRGAVVLGLGVFSHWVLAWLTHAPDMPLWPGSRTLVGLGLWNSLPGTLAVEVSMFVAGVALYVRATRPLGRRGQLSLWSLVLFLTVVYLGNSFGPPPPSVTALKVLALCSWLLIPWAAWIGRTRVPVAALALLLGLSVSGCDDGGAGAPSGSADLLARLNAIPGLHASEDASAAMIPAGYRFFQLDYDQPVDHTHPEGQRFMQHMTLLSIDEDAPMVQYSGGYGQDRKPLRTELTEMVAGNQLAMEHRYFLSSRPQPTDWSYLDIEQAAGDFHRINQALRTIYRGKWLATGGSKGGMAALFFRRFFPDDVDVTVPYVAPILIANDPRFAPFVAQVGDDPACRQGLADFQRRALTAKPEILALVDADATAKGWSFALLGEERAFEHVVLELPFIFWQYGDASKCAAIPPAGADAAALYAFLQDRVGMQSVADQAVRYFTPYYYQMATQFGWPANDETDLADLMSWEGTDVPAVYAASAGVTTPAYDAQAMADVLDWLATSCQRILFVYGENDPWSAAMVDVSGAPDCYRFIQPAGNHRSKIKQLAPADQLEVVDVLEGWLGVTVVIAADKPGAAEVDAAELRPPL